MTTRPAVPRIALFTDSFHEVNGVALTYRQLDAFVRRRGIPFFNVHAGPEVKAWSDGPVTTYELRRGWARFRVEADLEMDPLILRYRKELRSALEEFKPDIIHITGPSDIGFAGAYMAKRMGVPMTAGWHTNIHEYASWRLEKMLRFLPSKTLKRISSAAEERVLWLATKLYGFGKASFAPNPELLEMLRERTGKPAHLMKRGVDIETFSPSKRDRDDGVFEFGFVGRISAEKNVRYLAKLEKDLLAVGEENFRFVFVGHGGETEWLKRNMTKAVFPGVLKGEKLARAYANFDVFAFPSFTDTYGNVINEAMSSGTPVIVTTGGGPKYLIKPGETGFVAGDEAAFRDRALELMRDRNRLDEMGGAAREHAVENSWDRVFEGLYQQYEEALGDS